VREELRFDGRVAIVTGGGRGIGREHALLLASRGAAVVVNDYGVNVAGEHDDESPAEAVVGEIIAAGGQALANCESVADDGAATSIVEKAVESFGRLDILVNNAGVTFPRPFAEIEPAQSRREIEVHYLGSSFMARAAWPHLVASGSGRIINTTSSTIFGLPDHVSYGSAKGAIFGLTKNLATESAEVGIRVNAIAPSAATRMLTDSLGSGVTQEIVELQQRTRPPHLVPPAMAVLAHESCELNGLVLSVGGGRISAYFLSETVGWQGGPNLTPEAVAANLDKILDRSGAHAWDDVHESVRARLQS
jgi:NAD(P)-dependent dehydrogenase (short-subunit alcohol dehydrogenase family)